MRDDGHRGWRGRPARLVLFGGAVVDGHRGRARRVDLPRRHAGDHPADDAAQAGDVLVALAVSELQASREVRVAALRSAAALRRVAARLAEGEPLLHPVLHEQVALQSM